jgi:hypothetical protein
MKSTRNGNSRPSYLQSIAGQNGRGAADVKGMNVDAYAKSVGLTAATTLLAALLSVGCDNRETAVRSYSAPKDATTAPSPGPSLSANAVAPTATATEPLPLSWTLPAGWTQDPQPRQMRVATVDVESNGQRGELIVTRFRAGGFGSLVDNLNRWRQQVGLAPISNESEVTPAKTTVAGAEAKVYDFSGAAANGNPPQRNRVVMVETPAGDAWFFRLHGPADLVENQRAAFDSLLQSVKFDGAK